MEINEIERIFREIQPWASVLREQERMAEAIRTFGSRHETSHFPIWDDLPHKQLLGHLDSAACSALVESFAPVHEQLSSLLQGSGAALIADITAPPVGAMISQITEGVRPLFESVSAARNLAALAELKVSQIAEHSIRLALEGINEERIGLVRGLTELSSSYTDLYSTTDLIRSTQSRLTSFQALPPLEIVNAAKLVEVIGIWNQVEQDEFGDLESAHSEFAGETEAKLEQFLFPLDSRLLVIWQGAKLARESGNPDRARHCITSYRELFTHVLHRLAPDDEVRSWSQSKQDFVNGRPTRLARLRFVSRSVDTRPFSKFLEQDLQAVLAMIDVFQQGTHGLGSSITDTQLAALEVRVACALQMLLVIAEGAAKE